MPTFSLDVIKRVCSLPPLTADGSRRTEACGHPTMRYNLPSEYCVGCITASMRGGHAVAVPEPRNTSPIFEKQS